MVEMNLVKRLIVIAGWALGLLVCAPSLADESSKKPETATSPLQEESSESRTIPLSEILTLGPQRGMLRPRDVFSQKDNPQNPALTTYLPQIEKALPGASNVFLVDATSIHDAIHASTSIIVGARAARTPAPVNVPNPPRGNYWLVAYLGAGPSQPTWWTVERVAINENKMRVTYQESPPTGATRDIRHYFYWAPIGPLEAGIYELELYDAGRKMVSLMRRVEVGGAN